MRSSTVMYDCADIVILKIVVFVNFRLFNRFKSIRLLHVNSFSSKLAIWDCENVNK